MAKKNNTLTIISDADYSTWICDIATRYRQSQIRAAVRVNSELLHYYWTVGRDIHSRQFENRYGTAFYANASRDLRAELGVEEGFSETTLKYTKYFYELYAPLFPNRQQPADDFKKIAQTAGTDDVTNRQQPADDLMAATSRDESTNLQHPVEELPAIIRQQLVDDFDQIFLIPWSHHQYIIDKVKGMVRQAHQPKVA